MNPTDTVLAILLGLGLSASTGLNTFLPLLMLGAAARLGLADIALNEKFSWLTSDVALAVLLVAVLLEVIADKVPSVDHFLDSVGTFMRPVAGAVAVAAVLTDLDPVVAAVLGIIIGSPISFGFHTLKAGTRVVSSTATFGCANPILSAIEDATSFVLSAIAIFAPVIVPVLLALLAIFGWQLVQRVRRRSVAAPGDIDADPYAG